MGSSHIFKGRTKGFPGELPVGCEKETEVQDYSRIFDPVIRVEFLSNKIKKAFCRVDFVEGERLAHYITVELAMPINFPGRRLGRHLEIRAWVSERRSGPETDVWEPVANGLHLNH